MSETDELRKKLEAITEDLESQKARKLELLQETVAEHIKAVEILEQTVNDRTRSNDSLLGDFRYKINMLSSDIKAFSQDFTYKWMELSERDGQIEAKVDVALRKIDNIDPHMPELITMKRRMLIIEGAVLTAAVGILGKMLFNLVS